MPSLGIDGLASGLDTTSIINQLMQVAANPQRLLQSKATVAERQITALQGVNANLLALGTAAESAATASKWTSFSATSSADAATATAGPTAAVGSLTFTVDAVATAQVSLSAVATDGAALVADDPPSLTVRAADGSLTTVTAGSNSLDDMAAAINGAGAGVTATKVQVSAGATPTYRLQFTATETGADGSFEVLVGDEAAAQAGTAPRLDATTAAAATDASITLWKGSAAEQTYTQSSNTFTGLMTGVDVTITEVPEDGAPVTVAVASDPEGVKELASGLVDALGAVLSGISTATATSATSSSGTTRVSGGPLTGDSGMRRLQTALTEAAGRPVDGVSPSSVGIVIERDGSFTFDEDAFAAALADDPAGTATFVQTLAARIQGVAESQSDKYTGALTLQIQGKQSEVTDLEDQIADWDTRLELRRATLQSQFTGLETLMSNLTSQSSWLSSQIASLPSYE